MAIIGIVYVLLGFAVDFIVLRLSDDFKNAMGRVMFSEHREVVYPEAEKKMNFMLKELLGKDRARKFDYSVLIKKTQRLMLWQCRAAGWFFFRGL